MLRNGIYRKTTCFGRRVALCLLTAGIGAVTNVAHAQYGACIDADDLNMELRHWKKVVTGSGLLYQDLTSPDGYFRLYADGTARLDRLIDGTAAKFTWSTKKAIAGDVDGLREAACFKPDILDPESGSPEGCYTAYFDMKSVAGVAVTFVSEIPCETDDGAKGHYIVASGVYFDPAPLTVDPSLPDVESLGN